MTTLLHKLIFVLLFLIPLLLTIPQIQASGCFLYEDSPYYCKDITQAQALEECALQGCNIQTAFYQQSCATLPKEISCAKVLCKSTCTTIPAKDCTAGPVPVGQEDTWCNPGCCKYLSLQDTICISTINQNSCEQTAKSGQATSYEYKPTSASCVLECNRGLQNAFKATINQTTPSISSKTTPPPSTSDNNSLSTVFLSILIFMVLAIALIAFKVMKAKNTSYKLKKSPLNSPQENIEDNLPPQPNKTSPHTSQSIPVDPEPTPHQSKKVHQLTRLHAFENFKSTHIETNKSAFSKLNVIAKTKKTAIEKLQDLQTPHSSPPPAQKSAFNKEKNTPPQPKDTKKNPLEDVRKIALKKKE